jgi:hypothetical protein
MAILWGGELPLWDGECPAGCANSPQTPPIDESFGQHRWNLEAGKAQRHYSPGAAGGLLARMAAATAGKSRGSLRNHRIFFPQSLFPLPLPLLTQHTSSHHGPAGPRSILRSSDSAGAIHRLRVEPLIAITLLSRHVLHVPRPADSPPP